MADSESGEDALSALLAYLRQKNAKRLVARIDRALRTIAKSNPRSPPTAEQRIAVALDCILHQLEVPLWLARTRELLRVKTVRWANPNNGRPQKPDGITPLNSQEMNAVRALKKLRTSLPQVSQETL